MTLRTPWPRQDIPVPPSKEELSRRMVRLVAALSVCDPDWDALVVIDKVNQYYLTGTMQDAALVVKKDGTVAYFVRRSYERARRESPLEAIYPMTSYKDLTAQVGAYLPKIYLETRVVTCDILARLQKHIRWDAMASLDPILRRVRALKSPYELNWMREAGRRQAYLLEHVLPALLREGMSETQLMAELYEEMLRTGYQGVTRFAMFQTESLWGQVGFGENSLYPTSFNGPGGMKGLSPVAAMIGDRQRTLCQGDLVFIDMGYALNGYHTDRTQVYAFGRLPAAEVRAAHDQCRRIQMRVAAQLKPDAIPADIYIRTLAEIDDAFQPNFMGYGEESVNFLGHGVGLEVDEYPVLARGFQEPLQAGMTLALEPKKGLAGIGTVGVEDTYMVTPAGGKCLTGGEKEIILVK